MIQQLKLPTTKLSFRDEGQGDVILFVHGFPLDHSMWDAQVEHFSQTHRCIAVDLRGFGQSDVTRGTVTMAAMADDLSTLLDLLRIVKPVTFCGLSMGGYVGWQFWHRHSRKLLNLIQCDTRAIADTEDGAKQRLQTADKVETDGAEFLADTMLPKLYASETQSNNPDLLQVSRSVILSNAPEGIAAAARGMAARPDVTSWLDKIKVPVLTITGEFDSISSPEEMQQFTKLIPAAHHVIIPNAGHMAPQENPIATNQAIQDFLNTKR